MKHICKNHCWCLLWDFKIPVAFRGSHYSDALRQVLCACVVWVVLVILGPWTKGWGQGPRIPATNLNNLYSDASHAPSLKQVAVLTPHNRQQLLLPQTAQTLNWVVTNSSWSLLFFFHSNSILECSRSPAAWPCSRCPGYLWVETAPDREQELTLSAPEHIGWDDHKTAHSLSGWGSQVTLEGQSGFTVWFKTPK